MSSLERLVLEGHGARLEPLSVEHVEALRVVASGERESFRFTFVPEPENVERYVAVANEAWEKGEALPFAIRVGGRIVGSTRFGNVERWEWPRGKPRPSDIDAAEIGWTWLAPDVQRSHVNTACKRLLLEHAFDGLGAHRITLITDVRNLRSRAAIERLGAKLDGVLRAHFPAGDGSIRDTASYSILAAEWPRIRADLDGKLGNQT
jgi:RimJ/RimL family protein N-acetyltransferase